MQAERAINNSVIHQQRLSDSNIKQILNKRNKKDIKWCFELHNIFYKTWRFFELFKSFSEESSSSLLLKYYVSKLWQKSWLSSQNSISLIWTDLLAWGFVQSLLKWPGSSHLQHSSGCVGTAACWMGSDDLTTQELAAGGIEAFWLICWWCLSQQVMFNTTLW